MSINPDSQISQFEVDLEDGVLKADLNVAAGDMVSGHLRAALEQQMNHGRHVHHALIAFTEKLAAAAEQAAGVLAGYRKPTDRENVDQVKPSLAPVFSIVVEDDGVIEIDVTTKGAAMVSRTLRDYRDWRWGQGFELPCELGAFGRRFGELARAGRPKIQPRPIIQLPTEKTDRPLAKFLVPSQT